MWYFLIFFGTETPCGGKAASTPVRRRARRKNVYPLLESAIRHLGEQFAQRDWKYLDVPAGSPKEKTYAWPGSPEENIMICVHNGPDIRERFHRQNFFFFNFAYKGDYGAVSSTYDNHITIHENECYIGQPHAGYALSAHSEENIIIIGILIQKETFFQTFLPILSADANLFRFFLTPQINNYSDEFIHMRFEDSCCVRMLLDMMVIEYAHPKEDTQALLQPLVLTLFMLVARQYKRLNAVSSGTRLSDRIVRYMGEHMDTVTLKDIASSFAYHPNYISTLLRRDIGKSFSEILLELRMGRAVSLLNGTNLSIENIALMIGYRNSSNFYKAFREYYGKSPRDYMSTR